MCEQLGQIMDSKIQKGPKHTASFEEPGAKTRCWELKTGYLFLHEPYTQHQVHEPCTQHHKSRWPSHLIHPSGLAPTLTLYEELASPPAPGE